MTLYVPIADPGQFPHQHDTLDKMWDWPGFAWWWEQGCLDAQTEYLSPGGWRRMDQYDGGQVAQWHEDGTADFVQPTQYVKLPCERMYYIKSTKNVDQMLSPEHRVVLAQGGYVWVRQIDEIVQYLRRSPCSKRRFPAAFNLTQAGDGLGLSSSALRLQIAVLADGNFAHTRSRRCRIYLKKPHKIARLTDLLKQAGIEHEVQPVSTRPGDVRFSFIAPLHSKTFADDVWRKANVADMYTIADEVLRWDGTDTKNTSYFSKHEADVDFVQLCFTATGRGASKTQSRRGLWAVNRRSPYASFATHHITECVPQGKLKYCFMVPSTFLVLRRNGCVFVSGNTGKSREFIDNGGMLYCDKAIGGMFMLAPNGLHRNFITQQLKAHLPPDIKEQTRALFWHQTKSETKTWQNDAREFMKWKGLKVLSMSYDGIVTDRGKALAKEFLTGTKCLYGADEAARIANPNAWRTKVVLGSAPYAPFRRVMTGTPVANAPWDVWSQIKFVDDNFWKPHSLDSYEAMKAAFGEWTQGARRVPIGQAKRGNSLKAFYDKNGTPEELRTSYSVNKGVAFMLFPKVAQDDDGTPRYRNLNQLRNIIAPIRSRVLKKDVFKDLPPKLHTPLEFDMSPAQWRAYRSLEQMGFAITDGGETCSASMALTLMLRLQQIACGYIVTDLDPSRADPYDDDPRIRPIEPNPRLDLLKELVTDLDHQALIWARFTPDVDAICAMLKKLGKTVARYDGAITDDECAENEERFHRGDAQFFVSKASKGGEGLTLIEAKTAIFYSYTFKLTEYLQASDRPHRYGQTMPVNEIMLRARGTVEERIVQSLQAKMDVSAMVTGDTLKKWLTIDTSQGDLFVA